MSVELISILVLALIFLIATVRPVSLGPLAIVAAFIVGLSVLEGEDLGEKTDAIFAGFPGDLFVILVGVTYRATADTYDRHEALGLQLAVLDRLVAAGERLAGWKVGLTSDARRDAMGKGFRPFGYLLQGRTLGSGDVSGHLACRLSGIGDVTVRFA